MAKILADRDIKALLGSVLVDAEERYINPNGIELRLGKSVRFHSTREHKEVGAGQFLKVGPGETVIISSLEKIDFSADTVNKIHPGLMLMGLITPTTTMMREGISQVATKIDAGFRGLLNWGLRNGSTHDLIVEYGEPIFKLTVFLLDADEVPELPYGGREKDSYQDAEGIVGSTRRIPVDIPKNKLISSTFGALDPKKQLREAGYPFNHIATELVELQGKFEVVSKDVVLLKDQFEQQAADLSSKISEETRAISGRINDLRTTFFEKVEAVLDRKFLRVGGTIIGAIAFIGGALTFLEARNVSPTVQALMAGAAGVGVILAAYLLTRSAR